MKPYDAKLAVGGAKLVTENGREVTSVIFSVNYVAGIVSQHENITGSMGLWDKHTGKGIQINKVASADLKMYEEPAKEYWLALFAPNSGGVIGGAFKTEKEAFSFNAGMKDRQIVKVVEVK